MQASLWHETDFERHVEIGSGLVPDVLAVDDVYYIRRDSGDDVRRPQYERAVGVLHVHKEAVPIYVARLFEQPLVMEAKKIRLFSGCHGVIPAFREHSFETSWYEKLIVQARGIFPVRINGVYCPELPRDPGMSDAKRMMHDRASLALAFARQTFTTKRWQTLRFSGIGLDEYGRLICDVSIYEGRTVGDSVLTPFTPLALASGFFEPSRLVVE